MEVISKDLEYLVKEQIEKDYNKRHEKLVVPQDEFKKIIYNLKDEAGKPYSRDTQRRIFVSCMVFVKAMNDAGYNKWLPDFIKDTAVKMFLMNILDNKTFIVSMNEKEK